MGRLIDEDELIEDLKESYDDCEVQTVLEYFGIYEFIKGQPTAYDLDKVVEQLECAEGTVCGHKDITNNCGGCAGCTECDMEDAYRYAIEIVKAGVIDEETS